MTFIVRMAVRETRASWRRLLFFFLCIAVGVGEQCVGAVVVHEAGVDDEDADGAVLLVGAPGCRRVEP